MPTQQNNQHTLGVGLIPNSQSTKAVEQKILSYLNIHDLIVCAKVNKNPWHLRVMEEIKGRKRCVTIYTWPGERSSISITFKNWLFASRARLGHGALRTYSNSETGEGYYVSFYPGNCNTERRHPHCRKSISHFHTWNQDKSEKDGPVAIDLYGLDIEAINQAFQAMHDGNMNALKQWSVRHNCSDIVLHLLETGGLRDHLHYKWRYLIPMSIIYGRFILQLIDTLYLLLHENTYRKSLLASKYSPEAAEYVAHYFGANNIYFQYAIQNTAQLKINAGWSKDKALLWAFAQLVKRKSLFNRYGRYSIVNAIAYFFKLHEDKFYLFPREGNQALIKQSNGSHILADQAVHIKLPKSEYATRIVYVTHGLIEGIASFITFALTSFLAEKYSLPKKEKFKIAFTTGIKAMIPSLIEPLISIELWFFLYTNYNVNIYKLLPMSFIENVFANILNFIAKNTNIRFSKDMLFISLVFPLSSYLIYQFIKSLANTTNTPKYVYDLVKKYEQDHKLVEEKRQELASYNENNLNSKSQDVIEHKADNLLLEKLYENKFEILVGVSVATLGFFAYKNKGSISNFVKGYLPKVQLNLKF